MSAEVVPIDRAPNWRWRIEVPKEHRISLDTRLQWLWNQRFGTVQMVYLKSPDILDRTAATLIIQAIMAKDLRSIQQLFQRLEGGPQMDQEIQEGQGLRI
jgi:hypothetical protein